jgi:hypothetical protein
VLVLAAAAVLAAGGIYWSLIQADDLPEEVDLNGNPAPVHHGGLVGIVVVVLLLAVVVPGLRTGVAALHRRARGRR